MAGNLQAARRQVGYVAEDHSCLGNCAGFGVDRDARGGKEWVGPSTLLPSRVSREEGVLRWSMSMCRYAVAKMMSLKTTAATL